MGSGLDGGCDVPVAEVAAIALDDDDAPVLGNIGGGAEGDGPGLNGVDRCARRRRDVDSEVKGSAAAGNAWVAKESAHGVLLVEGLDRPWVRSERSRCGHRTRTVSPVGGSGRRERRVARTGR